VRQFSDSLAIVVHSLNAIRLNYTLMKLRCAWTFANEWWWTVQV